MTRHINMWSGPRNISTAIMYSFRQRADTYVVDEPLYGSFLLRSGRDDPGRGSLLQELETDAHKVVSEVFLADGPAPVCFTKNMAYHLLDVPHGFLAHQSNLLLVRDPAELLTSLVHQVAQPTLRDTGLPGLLALLERLEAWGQQPVVLDSRQVLLDPAGVLGEACRRLDLPWDPAMLQWPAGPKPEDGAWAPYWYSSVHQSTGFLPYRAKTQPVPAHVEAVLDQARPLYQRLFDRALRARPERHRPTRSDSQGAERRTTRMRPDHYYTQSAVIPVRRVGGELRVMLITSRRRKRWIVPKGVVEPQLDAARSAAKEALEEAGVIGPVSRPSIGRYTYQKWGDTCTVDVFIMQVEEVLEHWLEHTRDREWLTIEAAAARIGEPALRGMILSLPERVAELGQE